MVVGTITQVFMLLSSVGVLAYTLKKARKTPFTFMCILWLTAITSIYLLNVFSPPVDGCGSIISYYDATNLYGIILVLAHVKLS